MGQPFKDSFGGLRILAKLIIAGSRSIAGQKAYDAIESALSDCNFQITEIVSGFARGVDQTGERWARAYGLSIKRFFPDWQRFGKGAGIARNIEMGKYADRLLAIWDGKSHGTKQMINWMKMYGKPVQIVLLADKSKSLATNNLDANRPGVRA